MKRFCLGLLLLALLLSASVSAQEVPYDLGGRTIRIQTRWEDMTPLGARGDYNWYEPDAQLQAHIEAVEEMFNCKIEFVHRGHVSYAIDELRQSILAGDQPWDFFHVEYDIVGVAADGLIQPLNDVIEPDFYDDYPPMFSRAGFETGLSIGDTLYGFEALNHSQESKYLLWNKSLFEREGLESLYDIYDRGEWTWAKFEEIAHALTKDTDGDGIVDQYGIGSINLVDEINTMLVTNGVRLTKTDENGKMSLDLLQPEFIDTLEFMQKLYRDGVWAPRGQQGISNVGMYIQLGTTFALGQHRFGPPEDEGGWGVMMPPTGPLYKGEFNAFTRWMGVIPVYVENPREVIEVVCALWKTKYPYIDDLEQWEIDYWNRYVEGIPDMESYNFLKNPPAKRVLIPSQLEFDVLYKGGVSFFSKIVLEGQSATSTVASVLPQLQAILDQRVNQ